jgi:hypothetical protein
VNTLVKCEMRLSRNDEWEKIKTFKSLVGSLRYLKCSRPDNLFGVVLISWFMETPPMTHLKALKQIFWYIKGTINFGLFYGYSNNFDLVG